MTPLRKLLVCWDHFHKDQVEEYVMFLVCIIICSLPIPKLHKLNLKLSWHGLAHLS